MLEENSSILTALKLPGRVFPLPSHGLFYKSGELANDVKDAEIMINSLSGLAEMKFRSADLLFSGKAVSEIIKECAPQVVKPEKLLSKDVDSILAFIRLVTYGQFVSVGAKHNCENAKDHTYEIDLERIINESKLLTEDNYKLFFKIKLKNNQEIDTTPLTWEDAITMLQITTSTNMKTEDVNKLYVTTLTGQIQSIDGVTDRNLIEQWVKVAPAPFTKQIQEAVTGGLDGWGADFSEKTKCKDCGQDLILPLDLNPTSFFSL